jgi:exodeoxyribonuclease VII large subunit
MQSVSQHPASYFTVSELTRQIKQILERPFAQITLRGEVSNFKAHQSGHWYCTLKDAGAQIPVVIWRSQTRRFAAPPKDGQEVFFSGKLSVYAGGGRYQLNAEMMLIAAHKGLLFQLYEERKLRLREEGLFSEDKKKPIPLYPRGILIITSPSGAALQDVEHVAKRRFPGLQLYLLPVQVQGETAEASILAALQNAEQSDAGDVILLVRGGGSFEDLWVFNSELIVRAIAAMQKPVISGIGHETDSPLVDFVADVRAATPSAAAEMAIPARSSLATELQQQRTHLQQQVMTQLERKKNQLRLLHEKLKSEDPQRKLAEAGQRLDEKYERLLQVMVNRLRHLREALGMREKLLQSLGPNAILKRGFVVVSRNKKPVASVASLAATDEIEIRFIDGTAEATINKIKVANET